MALDLNHGIYIRRGGVTYFYGSYSHSVSPAIAFRVSGTTRYVPLVSGGSYLKVRRSGSTYGIQGASATITATLEYILSGTSWVACSLSISSQGLISSCTVAVTVTARASQSSSYTVSANTTSAGGTLSSRKTTMGKSAVKITVTAFGRTFTNTVSVSANSGTDTISVTIS